MAPSSYRLDTLAATLVPRLEGVRRAHLDDPEQATAAIRLAASEATASVAAECRSTLGDEGQALLLEREIAGIFVPRYTSLALAQSRDEARLRLGGIVGQVTARILAVPVGFILMGILNRVAAGPWDLLFLSLPVLMLFWPDLLGTIWRRRFAGQLQELADDLGKVQESAEKLAPTQAVEPLRPRPPQREVN